MDAQQKKPVNYLSNKSLLEEVIKSKAQDKMTDELAKKLLLLVDRYGRKTNWGGYSYVEDMKGFALMMLCRTWSSFDETRFDNAFAFFTQCIKNSFLQYLKAEKKQAYIRDLLLIDAELQPSFGFTEAGERRGYAVLSDEQDFTHVTSELAAINSHDVTDDPEHMQRVANEVAAKPITPDDIAGGPDE